MLVLSRKASDQILIGDNIVITVLATGPVRARLGIEAPKEVPVVRTELLAHLPPARTDTQTTDGATPGVG